MLACIDRARDTISYNLELEVKTGEQQGRGVGCRNSVRLDKQGSGFDGFAILLRSFLALVEVIDYRLSSHEPKQGARKRSSYSTLRKF